MDNDIFLDQEINYGDK